MPNGKELAGMIMSADPAQRKLYYNLYRNYNLINKNFDLKNGETNTNIDMDEDTIKKLNELETKVYTVNGKKLTEKQKINLEISNIYNYIDANYEEIPYYIQEKINDEISLLNRLVTSDGMDYIEVTNYAKKHITMMQAYLGMRMKFFGASLEVLNDEIAKYRIYSQFMENEEEKESGKGTKGI